jgi:hypothetical protein
MKPRFVTHILNWAPQDMTQPDMWQMEWPFAFLRSTGHLVICPPGNKTDGASYPRFLWGLPNWIAGHPFEGRNKFWSVPHDAGYAGWAIVIQTEDWPEVTPEEWLHPQGIMIFPHEVYPYMQYPRVHVPLEEFNREWWDDCLLEAMACNEENRFKRRMVHSAVRAFGGKPWGELKRRR